MSNEYYHTKESVDEYIRMAEGFSGKHIIEKLKKFLSRNSKILELGSGPGTDWQILSKDYHIIGSDYSSEFLNFLRKQNPGSQFLNLDAIHIKTKLDFDCIYSNKVLHHLTTKELKTSIKRQFDILNPYGIICHSFWQGEGSETYKGLYINYHTEDNLKDLFWDYFEIKTIKPYQEFETNDSIFLIGIRK